MSEKVPVQIKWQKKQLQLVIDKEKPISSFKEDLYKLTNVPPERQTILGFKGGKLVDGKDWESCGLKSGMSLVLLGSAEEIPKAPEFVQFVEDLTTNEDTLLNAWSGTPTGLVNMGNTCYMNATTQFIFASKLLRSSVANYMKENPNARTDSSKVVSCLHQVFLSLEKIPSRGPVVPLELLQQLRKVNPQFQEHSSHGVYSQQDAEECLSTLFMQLHQVLVSPKFLSVSKFSFGDSVIDCLFGIELETVDTCKDCPDEQPKKRKEIVRSLKCHISQNTSHLEQGLKEGLASNIELYSDVLQRTVEWARMSRISRLPPYLCIQFVRFFWKATEQVKAKILRNVSFPMSLDVYDFGTESLKNKIANYRQFETTQSSVKEEQMNIEGELPLECLNGQYELIAVLTHQGRAADTGHYVAWIRQEEKSQWCKFDDDKVSYCKEEEVKKLSGGGDWHMAYLCLYQCKSPSTGCMDTKTEEYSNEM
eukprot:jgi/Galph1/1720/GphlegSOOS_G401.1